METIWDFYFVWIQGGWTIEISSLAKWVAGAITSVGRILFLDMENLESKGFTCEVTIMFIWVLRKKATLVFSLDMGIYNFITVDFIIFLDYKK